MAAETFKQYVSYITMNISQKWPKFLRWLIAFFWVLVFFWPLQDPCSLRVGPATSIKSETLQIKKGKKKLFLLIFTKKLKWTLHNSRSFYFSWRFQFQIIILIHTTLSIKIKKNFTYVFRISIKIHLRILISSHAFI